MEPRGSSGFPVSVTLVGQTEGSAANAQSGTGAIVQASASRRRYRLADYIPTGVVDIAVSVEDINAFMVGLGVCVSQSSVGWRCAFRARTLTSLLSISCHAAVMCASCLVTGI